MRIYNGTRSTLTLPYTGGETLTIAPKTPSGNILCTSEFLSMLVTSYDTNEIAIVAAGPFELTACANVPTAVNYVVQGLDEAISRFCTPEPKSEEPEPELEEEKPMPEPEPEPEPEVVPEPEPEFPEETVEPEPEAIPEPEAEETQKTKPFKKKNKKERKEEA